MNSASQLTNAIANWKAEGHTRAELAVLIAEYCLGWPYVWGALGELCTVDQRTYYMNRGSIAEGDKKLIRERCQVMNGSRSSCDDCKYYPGSARTRIFDCRGFTRKVLEWADCGELQGGGCTSQYNDNSNWIEKGLIKDMPLNAVCCVFKYSSSSGKMEHTGLHIGGGNIIHCSVEVKRGKTSDSGWTHYAIPKKIPDTNPVDPSTDFPTLRKGSKGEYVTLLQTKLIQLGYDLSPYGADGAFGNKTLAAVKKYQADVGLDPDGIVGRKTWESLNSGEITLYTVTVSHVSKSVADEIVGKFGGSMTAEGKG